MTINWSALLKFVAGVLLICSGFGVAVFHLFDAQPGTTAWQIAFGLYMASDGIAAIIGHGGNILGRLGQPPKP